MPLSTLPSFRGAFAGGMLAGVLVAPGVASGAEAAPYARIESPANDSTLDAMAQNRLVYEVEPGPRGDHVHVYVDGREVGILRQLKGSYTLETLAPGERELCVKVVNKAHTPIGVDDCIRVRVD